MSSFVGRDLKDENCDIGTVKCRNCVLKLQASFGTLRLLYYLKLLFINDKFINRDVTSNIALLCLLYFNGTQLT